MSKFSLRKLSATVAAPAVAGVVALSTTVGAPAASAQQLPSLQQLSAHAQQQIDNFYGQTRDQAWQTRNDILSQAERYTPELVPNVQSTVDSALEFVFPGLIAQKNERAGRRTSAALTNSTAAPARQTLRSVSTLTDAAPGCRKVERSPISPHLCPLAWWVKKPRAVPSTSTVR